MSYVNLIVNNFRARNNESKGLLSKLSDDESEETELFIQRSPYKEIPTIEKYVEEGDTLQALSIRYQCPVSKFINEKPRINLFCIICR